MLKVASMIWTAQAKKGKALDYSEYFNSLPIPK